MAAVEDLTLPPELAVLKELAQELTRKHLLGPQSRLPLMNRLWQEILPQLSLEIDLVPLAEALSNALYHLCLSPSARPQDWLAYLQSGLAHGQNSSTELLATDLLAFAELCAWLSGMAALRERALGHLALLSDAWLACLWPGRFQPEILRQSLAQRWWHPDRTPAQSPSPAWQNVHILGGFRGWGGPFLLPPQLFTAQGEIWIQSESESWRMYADSFGWQLSRQSGLPTGAQTAQTLTASQLAALSTQVPTLPPEPVLAAGQDIWVLASPLSFQLWVFCGTLPGSRGQKPRGSSIQSGHPIGGRD